MLSCPKNNARDLTLKKSDRASKKTPKERHGVRHLRQYGSDAVRGVRGL